MPRSSSRCPSRTSNSLPADETKSSSGGKSFAKGWRVRPKCLRYMFSLPRDRATPTDADRPAARPGAHRGRERVGGPVALDEAVRVEVDHLRVLHLLPLVPDLHALGLRGGLEAQHHGGADER